MINALRKRLTRQFTHKDVLQVTGLAGAREVSPFILEADKVAAQPIINAASMWNAVARGTQADTPALQPILRAAIPDLRSDALIRTGRDAGDIMVSIPDSVRGGCTVPDGKVHLSIPLLMGLCRAHQQISLLDPIVASGLAHHTRAGIEEFDHLLQIKSLPKSPDLGVTIIKKADGHEASPSTSMAMPA